MHADHLSERIHGSAQLKLRMGGGQTSSSVLQGLVSLIWRDRKSVSHDFEANASTFGVSAISQQQWGRATATSQKREAIPRRARIEGSSTFVSLNSRPESH